MKTKLFSTSLIKFGFAALLVGTISVASDAHAFDASGGTGGTDGGAAGADAGGDGRSGETHGIEDRDTFSSPAAVARARNGGITPTISTTGSVPTSPFLLDLMLCSGASDPRCR